MKYIRVVNIVNVTLLSQEKDTLRLEVTVEDEVPGATNNLVRVAISLIVLDENDNKPVFSRVSFYFYFFTYFL